MTKMYNQKQGYYSSLAADFSMTILNLFLWLKKKDIKLKARPLQWVSMQGNRVVLQWYSNKFTKAFYFYCKKRKGGDHR